MIKLSNLIKEVSSSRGGTIKDSFFNIANTADEIEGENEGIDTYPITVDRTDGTADNKSAVDFKIKFGPGEKDFFHVYDYGYLGSGIDVTDEDNYQEEYDFSLGLPTGNADTAKRYAMKLGFKVEGMPKSIDQMDDDEFNTYSDIDYGTLDENVDGGVEFFKRIAFKK